MKLLIDAGNTLIKWAIADKMDWLHGGAMPVEHAEELQDIIAGLKGVRQVWVSNVAGEPVAGRIYDACDPSWQLHVIGAQQAQCGVRNSYIIPGQLGSDRWAALIAAWHMVQGACLVVSSGTATTVDALSSNGEFMGGLILPGVDMMQQSLCNTAAQLQKEKPEQGIYAPFPQKTADAVYSGALQAICGAIERQYALLCKACKNSGSVADHELNHYVPVVLSGGAATVLLNHLDVPMRNIDNLVLRGIWLISLDAP